MNFVISVSGEQQLLALQVAAAKEGLVSQDFLQRIVDATIAAYKDVGPVTIEGLTAALMDSQAQLKALQAGKLV